MISKRASLISAPKGIPKLNVDGAGVWERSHSRLETVTLYDKILTVFAGAALVIAGATAAYAGPRCPDPQI